MKDASKHNRLTTISMGECSLVAKNFVMLRKVAPTRVTGLRTIDHIPRSSRSHS